jgi:starch phosphorylase
VVPAFYTRDDRGIPAAWVAKMKHALRVAGQQFNARRMVKEYVVQHYAPAMRGNGGPDDPPIA